MKISNGMRYKIYEDNTLFETIVDTITVDNGNVIFSAKDKNGEPKEYDNNEFFVKTELAAKLDIVLQLLFLQSGKSNLGNLVTNSDVSNINFVIEVDSATYAVCRCGKSKGITIRLIEGAFGMLCTTCGRSFGIEDICQ